MYLYKTSKDPTKAKFVGTNSSFKIYKNIFLFLWYTLFFAHLVLNSPKLYIYTYIILLQKTN